MGCIASWFLSWELQSGNSKDPRRESVNDLWSSLWPCFSHPENLVLAVSVERLSIKTAELKGWRDGRIRFWNPHVGIQCHLLASAGTRHTFGTHTYIMHTFRESIHTHKIKISKYFFQRWQNLEPRFGPSSYELILVCLRSNHCPIIKHVLRIKTPRNSLCIDCI